MKKNQVATKNDTSNRRFILLSLLCGRKNDGWTRWKTAFISGVAAATMVFGTTVWAGNIPTPWDSNDPFEITADFILENDVEGVDPDATVLTITGSEYTFSNSKTISNMLTLDASGVKKLINTGTISNLTGHILARDLQNTKTIEIIGDENSGFDNVLDITGSLTNSGFISSMFGDIAICGDFDNQAGGVLESVEGDIIVDGTLTNAGDITNGVGSAYVVKAVTVINTGSIHQIESLEAIQTLSNMETGTLQDITTITTGTDTFINAGTIDSVRKVIGDTVNNGSISLGAGQNTMTFQGNLSNVTGTLTVGIDASQSPQAGVDNDLYHVVSDETGTNQATIQGGSVLVKIRPGNENETFLRGIDSKYTFLTAENGLTVSNGGFSIDPNSDKFKLFGWTAGYDSDSYWFWLDRDYKYGQKAPTYNTKQFGEYLDKTGAEVVPGSDYETVLEALDSLNAAPGQVSSAAYQAMGQLDGAIYGSLRTMTILNQSLINQQLGNLLRPMCEKCDCCEEVPGQLFFWGKYFGATGGVDSDGNAAGFDYSLSGVMVGLDANLGDRTRLGGYFSYIDSDMSVSGLDERADLKNYVGGLYLFKRDDSGYWLANTHFGSGEYDVRRHIAFGYETMAIDRTQLGNTSGNQSGVRLERGFNFMTNHALYQPFMNLQYAHADTEAVHESGTDSTSLLVDAGDYNSFRTELGGRILINNNLLSTESVNSRIMFQASWIHEYKTSYDSITATTDNRNLANYMTTAHYRVRGTDLGKNWCNLGMGLDWVRGDLSFHGGYDFLLNGRQNLSTGNAGLALVW